jgi:hypothetical protein
MSVLRTLFSILLLKQGPQDLPFSQQLLNILVLLYVAIGVMVLQGSVESGQAAGSMILDVLIILFYTYIVLNTLNKKQRFVQAATAMVGAGILFHLLAWPMMAQLITTDDGQSLTLAASMAMLLLISWNLLVVAHIFRQTLESGMTNAILLSFALFFISITLSRLLFNE